jgi:hypothetical protein
LGGEVLEIEQSEHKWEKRKGRGDFDDDEK